MPNDWDDLSDAEQYAEYLTRVAVDGTARELASLGSFEAHTVLINRTTYTRLMLVLAVKLEAGVAPGMPQRAEGA